MKTHMRIPFLIVLGLGLLVAAPTRAQQAAETVGTHDEGPSEGIHVSGQWTFEIYEADGRLVEERTIQNALASTGPFALSRLLARDRTVGSWSLQIAGSSSLTHLCVETISDQVIACVIAEPSSSSSESHEFNTLQISAPPPSAVENAGKLVLQGNFTSARSGDVGAVVSLYTECDSDLSCFR